MDTKLIFDDLDRRFRHAIQEFWNAREAQRNRQEATGRVDAGNRGSVTGGSQMRALELLVADLLRSLDLPDLTIRMGMPDIDAKSKRQLELPGYYRPEKQWDMIVLSRGLLVAAIEFKAQVGPSFGNNINNRTEEALGCAEDIWKAYREERFGANAPEPFLGYMFLLEDCPDVHRTKTVKEPFFKVDPAFKTATAETAGDYRAGSTSLGVSYARRYEILCRRLRLERLYAATCLVLTTNSADTIITEPVEDLTFRRFIATLIGHANTFALSQN